MWAQHEKMEQKDLMLMRQWEDINSLMERVELLELTEEKEEQLWDSIKKRTDALCRMNDQMKEKEKRLKRREEDREEKEEGERMRYIPKEISRSRSRLRSRSPRSRTNYRRSETKERTFVESNETGRQIGKVNRFMI